MSFIFGNGIRYENLVKSLSNKNPFVKQQIDFDVVVIFANNEGICFYDGLKDNS